MYKSILYGGVNITVRHKDFPSHKHYQDEIYLCLGGSATDTTEGRVKKAVAGDVYVRRKGVTHRQTDIVDFYCCVFQFDRDELLKRAGETGLSDRGEFHALFESDDGIFIGADAVRYVEIISDIIKSEDDLAVRDTMFLNLLTVIFSKSAPRETQDVGSTRKDMEKVVRYIEHNYDKAINLAALAELSHYSRRHFTRLFRELCGASPMEYLNSVRIKNASDLLVRSDMNIIEISRLCGFEDNNLFSRRFKAYYGTSPSQYRWLNRVK